MGIFDSVLRSTLAVAAVVVTTAAAQAGSISVLDVRGSWTSVSQQTTTEGLTGVGTDEILWGTPFAPNPFKSGYTIEGIAGAGSILPDEVFDVAKFTHHNFAIGKGTSILGAKLQLDFDILFEADSSTATISAVFDFEHWETPNYIATSRNDPNFVCANGGFNWSGVNAKGCADRVTAVTNVGQSETFMIGDDTYIIDVTGFLVGGVPLEHFWTMEEGENSAILQAQFKLIEPPPPPPPPPIPLPAAGWMLLAGVGGLAGLRARRRSA